VPSGCDIRNDSGSGIKSREENNQQVKAEYMKNASHSSVMQQLHGFFCCGFISVLNWRNSQ